jgi:hypothetical protein
MPDPDHDHWLVRAPTVRLLWRTFIALLVAVVGLDLFVTHRPHFGIDGTFGFGAWYGFLACVVLVALAKAVGSIFKRPDTYYDR